MNYDDLTIMQKRIVEEMLRMKAGESIYVQADENGNPYLIDKE